MIRKEISFKNSILKLIYSISYRGQMKYQILKYNLNIYSLSIKISKNKEKKKILKILKFKLIVDDLKMRSLS